MTLRSPFATALLVSAAVLSSSCRRPEIHVYTVPKDPPPAPERTADAAGAAHSGDAPAAALPKVTWVLPAGWEETAPNKVSVAAFAIKTGTGEAAVTVAPLPNLRGQEALVINMYRQQAGLPPLEQSEIPSVLSPVTVADGDGQLLDLNGKSEGQAVRMVTAIAHREERSWFIRLSGPEAAVTAQKPAFLEFLKSLHFVEAPVAEAAPPAAPGGSQFHWTVPPGWQELPPGQMQVAKFAVADPGGSKAEVFVSIFPNDTGGVLANVNRWRKQLGLDAVDEAGLGPLVAPLDPTLPRAVLVTLSNPPRAVLGAIIPRGEQWWFYKLLGDEAAVTAQREAFAAFAKIQP